MKMMSPDSEKLLKRYRRKPLASLAEPGASFVPLAYDQEAITHIIPHRPPFLLLDRLKGLWREEEAETICGEYLIREDDPVLQGHFPDFPLYPGSLQLEMGGQLGLCLTHFVVNNTDTIGEHDTPVQVRATKVLGALFLSPLLPGRKASVFARRLEYDGYFGTVLSQVLSEGKVCTVSISEVIFLDESAS